MKSYVESGELIALGVVQEQHPDRTRLYRQWRQLDWPIFVDSMNTLEHVTVVPIPMAIDEIGIVVDAEFEPNKLDAFMKVPRKYGTPVENYNVVSDSDLDSLLRLAKERQTSAAWRELGAAYFNYGEGAEIGRAVDALETAVELDRDDGKAYFALGTALRRRYEGSDRRPDDAQRAVENWGRALGRNPNHYIWRRRLQQYGPRLDKPYNFYFWVAEARKEITARGDQPLELAAEPMGSELAPPERDGSARAGVIPNPDPDGRIFRDEKSLVRIETLATPARVQPGQRVRARVTFRLNEAFQPLWNNEADDLTMWVGLPDGVSMVERDLRFTNPETPETMELRQLEVEVAVVESMPEGPVELLAYALYYVCEDAGGVCYYLRQDFTLFFHVDAGAAALR